MKISQKIGLFLAATFASVASFAQQAVIDAGPIVTEINGAKAPLSTIGAAIIGVGVVVFVIRRISRLIG